MKFYLSIPHIFGLPIYQDLRHSLALLIRSGTQCECEKSFISCQKQNVPGRSLSLCMGTRSHSADDQLRVPIEEFPDAFHLLAETAALGGGEILEWLHGDGEFSARAAQVPDPGNRAVDEQHREVSGLATGSQCAFGSRPCRHQSRAAAVHYGMPL